MRIRGNDYWRLVSSWLASAIALIITGEVLPGLDATSWWVYFGVAAVTGVVGLLMRPVLVAISARIGWIAILLVTVFGQAILLAIAIYVVPGITVNSAWTVLGAAWISAMVGTAVAWAASAGTDDALTMALLRKRVDTSTLTDPDLDGVVFLQLDGVAFPVLQWAIQAGSVPTIRSWLASGDYLLREWSVQMPCTTPASQLGILHGVIDQVPAFRWYDRELGRLLVANRPADAAVIEARATNGRGLLADNGVSVSNLFTGDAERSAMVMSRLAASRGSTLTRRSVAWFLARPDGFARSLTRTIAEIIKERFQAKRQERRKLEPRTHRGWTFAMLRAVTNALLRDLNTAVVADEMLRGTKVVYVDYVDYDEIAHHAGMFRPESLAALDGVDRVLGTLRTIADRAPRNYHLVVLSDHGQSQGTPFKVRAGYDLATLCANLTDESVRSSEASVEGLGRAEAMVDDIAGGKGLPAAVAKRASTKVQQKLDDAEPTEDPTTTTAASTPGTEFSVLGSGNLGLLYHHQEQRHTIEEIEENWPRLIPGLTTHDGIAFVAGLTNAGEAVAIGPTGSINLTTGTITGDNPLAFFPDHSAAVLERATMMVEAPDLYINSDVNPSTLDVAAFEPLVGCHGGLGGWQDRGSFLFPTSLIDDPDHRIQGADEMHNVLVGILERLGQRKDLATPTEATTE